MPEQVGNFFRVEERASAWGAIVAACLMATAVVGAEPAPADRAAGAAFTFDADLDYVFLPVEIGGRDYRCVVDTAAANYLDVSLRPLLGPRLETGQMLTPSGIREMGLYAAPAARVGPLPLCPTGTVNCSDFAALRESTGFDIRGLVGLDFLRNWITRIDFDRGRIEFLDPRAAGDRPDWGDPIPLSRDAHGLTWVTVTVGAGQTARFVIDTGWRRTGSLDAATAAALAASGDFRKTGATELVDQAGRRAAVLGRLAHASLGSFRSENLQFSVGNYNILGLNYLRRFGVVFDYAGQRLYLTAGKRFAEPDRGSMSGLLFRFRPAEVVVTFADENGPAYAAGVRAGDRVQKINDRPIADLTSADVQRIVKSPGGAPVELALQRDGKPVDARFVPQQYD